MDVLIVGPWGPLSFAAARSLQRQGVGVYVLQASAQNRTPGSFSLLRGSTTIPAPLSGTREGLDLVKRYVADSGVAALIATIDSELVWLAENRHEFEPSCRVLVQAPESLVGLLSKRRQIDLARRAGLPVLPTYCLANADDVDRIPVSEFPIAVRPDRPEHVQPGFKVRLATSPEQLETLIRESRIVSAAVAQPFRCLPNLVVHGARSVTGDVIASRCYLVPRKFEGVSLSIEPWRFPPGLEQQCDDFARLAGITGCYHFEFLFSPVENRAWFLEVNVRLGGTTDKVVRTGFDEPRLLLEAYGLLPRSARPSGSGSRRVVNKRTLLRHMMWAATGKLTALDHPDGGRFSQMACSCLDFFIAKDSIFDWRDMSGSIRFHLRR